MNVIKVENYEAMSQTAAKLILEKVIQYPAITLGLATGGTPLGTYQHLTKDHKKIVPPIKR